MPTVPAAQLDAPHTVDEEFLELMCADEEFIRAEFDAIIAQEWSSRPPPADPPPASPATGPHQGWQAGPPALRSFPRRPRRPGIGGWSRQRSPPPHPEEESPHRGTRSESNDEDGRKVGGCPTPLTHHDEAATQQTVAWAAFVPRA